MNNTNLIGLDKNKTYLMADMVNTLYFINV